MAKIYGLFGAMTGKLADTVMAVRSGEQFARKYQPMVHNPNTSAQVAQRAKMKAMSQLSSVMGPVIAIPKRGTVSARNMFTKVNFKNVTYTSNSASVDLTKVTLTNSIVALPDIQVPESNIPQLSVPAPDLSRVVYIIMGRNSDGTMRIIANEVVSTPGTTYQFPMSNAVSPNADRVLYAYGVRDNTDEARVKFGDLSVLSAQYIATLVASRQLTENDVTLTETKSVLFPRT